MFTARLRADLELRLLEERHAAAAFALVDQDRAHVGEWLAWVEATESEDDTRAFIRSALEQFAANAGITAGIWFENRFAGVIGTHKIDWVNRKVEIGYWLGREFQGRGIMTEACRALVRHLLIEMELNRVEIRCAVSNTKSCAIPKRLGFRFEGTLRDTQLLRGKYHDTHVWSMLRSELAS